MPATSIRDLIIKDDDLAVATHGRGFSILDNITPLRQLMRDQRNTALFKTQTALRIRLSHNTDTPIPPAEPARENAPDSQVTDYFMGSGSSCTFDIKGTK